MRRGTALVLLLALFVGGCVGASKRELKEAQQSRFRLKYKLGLSYIQSGRYKEALLEFLEAEKLNPTSAELYNSMGVAYLGLGERDKALDSFKKAVAFNPMYSQAHTNLATLYIQKRQWESAVQECNLALKNSLYLTPESAYNNRGYAYQMMGKGGEAVEDYYRAIRYNPRFTKAYENLISYYISKERMRKAQGILDDAVALGLRSPGLMYYRGFFKNMAGDKEAACDLFKQLVRDYPITVWAKKARAYLDLLGPACQDGAPLLR